MVFILTKTYICSEIYEQFFIYLTVTVIKFLYFSCQNSAGFWSFRVNNRNPKLMCGICSKLTIKTPKRHHWRHSSVFIINFGQISHIALVFPLLTMSKRRLNTQLIFTCLYITPFSIVSIVDFEQIIIRGVVFTKLNWFQRFDLWNQSWIPEIGPFP